MFKTIDTLAIQRDFFQLSDQDLRLYQQNLIKALTQSAENKQVIALFAHGDDALRVIKYYQPQQQRYYWVIQFWSHFLSEWISQYCYQFEQKQQAIAVAANYYPAMSVKQALAKWQFADHFDRFYDYAQLAEFYYDTKTIEWPDAPPWPALQLIAETLIEGRGMLANDFSFTTYAKYSQLNLSDLSEKVLFAMQKFDLLAAQYISKEQLAACTEQLLLETSGIEIPYFS